MQYFTLCYKYFKLQFKYIHLMMEIKLYKTLVPTYIIFFYHYIFIIMWIEILIKFIKQIKHKALCNEC